MGKGWLETWAAATALALGACSRSAPRPAPSPAVVAAAPLPPASADASAAASATSEAPAAETPPPLCGAPGHVAIFVMPEHPVRGRPMRVVAVSDHAIDGRLVVGQKAGEPSTSTDRRGGPPYYWLSEVDAPAAGAWHASFGRGDRCPVVPGAPSAELAKKDIAVGAARSGTPPAAPPFDGALWPVRSPWSPSLENLYSVWIDHMFDDPLDAQPSWNALHEVLRDRPRNLLFDYLGAAEDEQGVVVKPDCADLPYFLRAYFAYKLGLPFGWSRCTRGDLGVPPVCSDFATNLDPFPPYDGKPQSLPVWADPDRPRDPRETAFKRFGEFLRSTLADAVQSGAGRTPAKDETGDYYPVVLSVETLRPGTIFADPYGHVLVVAHRIDQTPSAGGVLLAVDGQPDGTVARKRFWQGNFLFAIDPSLGSAGFKRFRPIVRADASSPSPRGGRDAGAGALRRLGNAELPDYSLDQYSAGVDGFYDKVKDVLSPAPLDPTQALLETIVALEEQVKTRANSVDNGRKFLASGKPAAQMPDGAKIFEASGSWEDFSTPSRDLRLLIAVDVARGVPALVARRPDRYAMPAGTAVKDVQKGLEERLARELQERTFRYTRSDGSEWPLRLSDVVARQVALEVAYNPNDCVEARWGATEGSDEASTCRAHAPEAQVAKMQSYRDWFHERRRPPR